MTALFVAGMVFFNAVFEVKCSASTLLSPWLMSDAKPMRNTRARIIENFGPNAIGKGRSLLNLSEGNFLTDVSGPELNSQLVMKCREAVRLAVNQHLEKMDMSKGVSRVILDNLMGLEREIGQKIHLYEDAVVSEEDYCLAFFSKGTIGFSEDFINVLHDLSPMRLAQCIYRISMPLYLGGSVSDHLVKGSITNERRQEILSLVFGEVEVREFEQNVANFVYSHSVDGTEKPNSSRLDECEYNFRYIVKRGDQRSRDVRLVGGKGKGLAVLAGLDVKTAEHITLSTEAFWEHVKLSGAEQCILEAEELIRKVVSSQLEGHEESETQELRAALYEKIKEITTKIESTDMNSSVQDEIRRVYPLLSSGETIPLAVRSSSTAEDLVNDPYAGQYETYLNQKNVEQVIASVKRCWLSNLSVSIMDYHSIGLVKALEKVEKKKAEKYLANFSIPGIAVVLQEMVDSVKSAVAFNVHPATGEEVIRIAANYGLGETVVGSETDVVNPEIWELDPESFEIISQDIGSKTNKSIRSEDGGTVIVDVPDEDVVRFAMSEHEVKRMAKDVAKIGKYFKSKGISRYIDTEFAVKPTGEIVCVQVRPETQWSLQPPGEKMIDIVDESGVKKEDLISFGGKIGNHGVHYGRMIIVPESPFEEGIIPRYEEIVKQGDILVIQFTTPAWNNVLSRLGGLITEHGDVCCHGALTARNFNIPCILAMRKARTVFNDHDGKAVTIDASSRKVFNRKMETIKVRSENMDLLSVEREKDFRTFDEEVRGATASKRFFIPNTFWVKNPMTPYSKFQIWFYGEAYKLMSERFGIDIGLKVIPDPKGTGWIICQDVRDVIAVRRKFREFSLDELEEHFAKKKESLEVWMRNCRALLEFQRGEELKQFSDSYVDALFYTHSGRNFVKGIRKKLYLWVIDRFEAEEESYKYFRYLTDLMKYHEGLAFKRPSEMFSGIMAKARKHPQYFLRDFGNNEELMCVLKEEVPGLHKDIINFTICYSEAQKNDFRFPLRVGNTIESIRQCLRGSPGLHPLFLPADPEPPVFPEELKKYDEDGVVSRLSKLYCKNVAYNRVKQHYGLLEGGWILQQALLKLGDRLVDSGSLSQGEDVFNMDVNDLLSIIKNNEEDMEGDNTAMSPDYTSIDDKEIAYRAHHARKALSDIVGKAEGRTLLIAIDSDLGKTQWAKLMPVIVLLRRLQGLVDDKGEPLFPGLKVISGSGSNGDMMREVNKLLLDGEKSFKKEDIILVGDADNVKRRIFGDLEGVSWIAGIDRKALDPDGYVPLIETITMLALSALDVDIEFVHEIYNSISMQPLNIRGLKKMIKNRIFYVLPSAEKYDIPLQKKICNAIYRSA